MTKKEVKESLYTDRKTIQSTNYFRKVNKALSWKIPLQIVGGDANKLKSLLGSLDALKSAMIVGDPMFGAQFTSKQVGTRPIFLLQLVDNVLRFMLGWCGLPQGPIILPMPTMPWSCITSSVVGLSLHFLALTGAQGFTMSVCAVLNCLKISLSVFTCLRLETGHFRLSLLLSTVGA